MDAPAYLLIVMVCAASGMPMVEDDNLEKPDPTLGDVVTDTEPTTTTEIIEAVETANTCTTARNGTGTCVQRASCEYSTNAIDSTLYAPKGYVKPCGEAEVCCPLEYIVKQKSQTNDNNLHPISDGNDATFDFDKDD